MATVSATRLRGYEVPALIGQGWMAEVYRAWEPSEPAVVLNWAEDLTRLMPGR